MTTTKTQTVEQIMTTHAQTIDFNATVAEALGSMTADKFNSIPVVNANRECVGILSRADLTETLMKEDSELASLLAAGAFSQLSATVFETCDDKRVREVMTHEVVTVFADASIQQACNLMAKNQIHHLPVVDSSNIVIGIVSTFDVIGWFANQ